MPFRKEYIYRIGELPIEIREFIERLVNDYRPIIEIWLFGSAAQGKKNANDWDFLIVAMDQGATFGLMGKNLMLKDKAEKLRIHLFIHGTDNDAWGDYYCPWERSVSKPRDKFNLREKITWPAQFEFQYSGENKENFGMCVWDRESGSDSFLNSHFQI